MTQPNYTHIIFVLDRSGSMQSVQDDTIGGFNRFLEDQKKVGGKATVTTVLFDASSTGPWSATTIRYNSYAWLRNKPNAEAEWPTGDWYLKPHDFVDIQEIKPLTRGTYQPRGGTALLDACRRAIEEEGKRLAAMPETHRPSQVICVIMTDGQENQSWNTTNEQLQGILRHQRDVYKWEFVFLGANQDAFAGAASLGVHAGNAINYISSEIGTRDAFISLSRNMSAYRSSKCSTTESFFGGKTEASDPADNIVEIKSTTSISS